MYGSRNPHVDAEGLFNVIVLPRGQAMLFGKSVSLKLKSSAAASRCSEGQDVRIASSVAVSSLWSAVFRSTLGSE